MSAATTSGGPSRSRSVAAAEARIAACEAFASTSPLVNARPPVCSGSGSQRTGQPGSSVPSRRMRVHDAVRGPEDQLVAVVAVEVDQHRRGRAVARQVLREAGQHVLVAVQVQVAAVLAGERLAALRARHDDAHDEPVGLGVRAAVEVRRARARARGR